MLFLLLAMPLLLLLLSALFTTSTTNAMLGHWLCNISRILAKYPPTLIFSIVLNPLLQSLFFLFQGCVVNFSAINFIRGCYYFFSFFLSFFLLSFFYQFTLLSICLSLSLHICFFFPSSPTATFSFSSSFSTFNNYFLSFSIIPNNPETRGFMNVPACLAKKRYL